MKKICLIFLIMVFMVLPAFAADREAPSYAIYSSSTLIKTGDAKVYGLDFIATSANGNFALYDALTSQTEANIRTEGQEATSGNSEHLDFTRKPLEFSTGLYLAINNGTIVIRYR